MSTSTTPYLTHPHASPVRLRRRGAWLALTLAVASLAGCNTVEFHERRLLADPAMQETQDEAETHFLQKVRYSDEGAAGGIGTGAGGGCGCY
ncbi:MAG: DUF4266 domain-containing protein [Planctomycetota bacterium]